jgi:hypothetical protein
MDNLYKLAHSGQIGFNNSKSNDVEDDTANGVLGANYFPAERKRAHGVIVRQDIPQVYNQEEHSSTWDNFAVSDIRNVNVTKVNRQMQTLTQQKPFEINPYRFLENGYPSCGDDSSQGGEVYTIKFKEVNLCALIEKKGLDSINDLLKEKGITVQDVDHQSGKLSILVQDHKLLNEQSAIIHTVMAAVVVASKGEASQSISANVSTLKNVYFKRVLVLSIVLVASSVAALAFFLAVGFTTGFAVGALFIGAGGAMGIIPMVISVISLLVPILWSSIRLKSRWRNYVTLSSYELNKKLIYREHKSFKQIILDAFRGLKKSWLPEEIANN